MLMTAGIRLLMLVIYKLGKSQNSATLRN
jgi:hypothetical protein